MKDYYCKYSSTRKGRIWITVHKEAETHFINVAVEINVLEGTIKINWISLMEYGYIDGNKEIVKEYKIETLGNKEDTLIKVKALNFAIEKGYVKKVCKRLGIEYK